MTLADFTKPEMIVPHLLSRDATSAIHELSCAMHHGGGIPDLLPFYHEALNREFLLSTDMEVGLAFPHARLPSIRQLAFAFGRSDEPFVWSPKLTHPVRMVFLLAVPADESMSYFALVSGLARLANDRSLLERLCCALEPAAAISIFREVALRRIPQPQHVSSA